ncbi:hypothetical protein J5J86_22585 [Aquabacter sp. L1I39]|uniref:hypothetical protein n=1 Tax=Aquabacter sp. L1I39 TaxID=2820278 RepID=UPI001ADBA51A|nr:hypothetical protein [Aquabacter sp. L1I39]QTL03484.1 hypothetical protein J5J86_22585 [Aquabacter sp. L1I39]
MRTAILAALLTAICLPAAAQEVNALQLNCAQARGWVNAHGAALIRTSPSTFDRYVRDRGFCVPPEDVQPEWIRTRDVAQCFVGYTCFDPSRDRSPR